MSRPDNYIDLTLESDDEAGRRDHNHVRTQPRPSVNTPYFRVPPPQRRDNLSISQVRSSSDIPNPYNYSPNMRPQPPRNFTAPLPQLRQTVAPRHHINEKAVKRQTTSTTKASHSIASELRQGDRRACVNCREVGVTCDGEQPCSACVEPGLGCVYPGEKPTFYPHNHIARKPIHHTSSTSSQETKHGIITSSVDLATRVKSPVALTSYVTQQSDLAPNSLISSGQQSNLLSVSGQSQEQQQFYDSDESDDDDDVPLALADLEEVKRLLKRHEARMRDHRAYLLQPLLNQAKLDASKTSGPQTSKVRPSPFVKLIATAKAKKSGSPNKLESLLIQIKSHKIGAAKKWTSVSLPVKVVNCDATILPKYKSIGRLGTSLLAPNIRTLKYWPYFPDEEELDPSEAKKNEELEERYQHDDNHLLAQRKCSELVDMWRPWVEDFVSKLGIEFRDILYWFLHTPDRTTCETCDREILADAFVEVARLLNKPSERSLTLARLSAMALQDVARISMWHIALGTPSVKDIMRQTEAFKESSPTMCSICFLHNCLSHGAYQEPEETGGTVIMGGNVEINDEEVNHNVRLSASVPNQIYEGVHQCGLYCVAAEARIKDILGRKKTGTIGGIHNHTIHVPHLTFDNDKSCSEDCFWFVERRAKFATVLQAKGYEPKISEESKILFRRLLRTYSDNQRAPCMLSKDVEGLICVEAFYFVLSETQRASHYRQMEISALQQGARKVSKLAAGLDTTLSADLDERPPFVPCSHAGQCLNNPECSCAQSKVHCEWFCGCDKSCDRRFPGCKCAGLNKTCFNDRSCECWKHNRECDPWLCGTCGTVEVLDPQNRYNEDIRKGRCKNNRIQLELPARTIKAPSEVQGWGLYAGENIEENCFIGEYKGETVGNQESDRRGAVYANIGQEYLFVMNRDQQIDGSNFGNKTRFINNSQRDDYINVFAKKLLCNGIQRVMLYAKKPILVGEELLYNYNYPVSVTKKFWERGEAPTSGPGAVTAKPAITWSQPRVSGRFAKAASKQDGEQSPVSRFVADDDEPLARKDIKRKRTSDGDALLASAGWAAGTQRVEAGALRSEVPAPDDVQDSDFELIEASAGSESMSAHDDDADSDEANVAKMGRRRRVVHATDRRRGGLAQAKAWETRRKRNAKGK